jgi:hypothetical protein
MVEKLLNIEHFSNENSVQSKLTIIGEFGCTLGVVGKP